MTKTYKKRVDNKNNHPNLRTPDNLPAHSAWAREEDQSFYRSLVKQGKHYEAMYFLKFLESMYGNNPQLLSDSPSEHRAAYTATDANARDVMNTSRIESIDPPKGVFLSTGSRASHLQDNADKTALAQRHKQHIDSCQQDTHTNHIENALNELLDKHAETQSKTRRGNVTLVMPTVPKTPRKPRS